MASDSRARLLTVSALSVTYASSDAPAAQGVSFALDRGESLGLVGESGSGKTTVALALLGLLPRDARCAGSVRFDDVDILSDPEAVTERRWRDLAVVFQDAMNALNPVITIGEQIAELWVTHDACNWRAAHRRVPKALERVGLSPALTRCYPHELSGGMRQRVALAMAIALSPRLVIVDEPTSALDVVASNAMVDTLNAARRDTGAAFLVISHDISVIARTCDHAVVMHDAEVIEAGPVRQLLFAPTHAHTRRLLDSIPRLPASRP